MSLTLESLGFTKDELQERVIDQLVTGILSGKTYDEDGEAMYDDSHFKKELEKRLKEHINTTIGAIAEKHVLPNVTSYIENLCLQQTNTWGERTGSKLTFIEYLMQRTDAYIREEVNSSGKAKSETDSYNWTKSTTRISYLINAHLQFSIENAMKQALATANSAIAGGIEKAVKVKLEEIVAGMKVAVSTGR